MYYRLRRIPEGGGPLLVGESRPELLHPLHACCLLLAGVPCIILCSTFCIYPMYDERLPEIRSKLVRTMYGLVHRHSCLFLFLSINHQRQDYDHRALQVRSTTEITKLLLLSIL